MGLADKDESVLALDRSLHLFDQITAKPQDIEQ